MPKCPAGLDLTNQKITNLGTPTASADAATKGYADSLVPYKRYVALLSQSGGSAPTATVLENTLGGTIVWTRTGTGNYAGTLANAFTVNKTMILIGSPVIDLDSTLFNVALAARQSKDVVQVFTQHVDVRSPVADVDDNLLNGTAIEIRVYL